MNPHIKHLLVTTTTTFDARGNPQPVTQYSYYVESHGPFVDKYPEGGDTPEAVNMGFEKRVHQLVAVGALPAGS